MYLHLDTIHPERTRTLAKLDIKVLQPGTSKSSSLSQQTILISWRVRELVRDGGDGSGTAPLTLSKDKYETRQKRSFWRALFGNGRTGGTPEKEPTLDRKGAKGKMMDGFLKSKSQHAESFGKTTVMKEKLTFVKVKPVWRERSVWANFIK
ncbi:hypothetical protein AVEN_228283-1 [Araneus ventricosus]|uniref:Uncharacterized protein n=1 Tax=Araneus ventricosus TaxID=182803 RepID=A0A4Y2E9J8_ARAVE|nr:hypothetical protein AVEN_228283-1 [Araneus ventricosus]